MPRIENFWPFFIKRDTKRFSDWFVSFGFVRIYFVWCFRLEMWFVLIPSWIDSKDWRFLAFFQQTRYKTFFGLVQKQISERLEFLFETFVREVCGNKSPFFRLSRVFCSSSYKIQEKLFAFWYQKKNSYLSLKKFVFVQDRTVVNLTSTRSSLMNHWICSVPKAK